MTADGKNREIEVLRAFGILFVIVSHLGVFMPWNPQWLQRLYSHTAFWGGVDLFFAVSGFVITRNLLPLINEKNPDRYWYRVGTFWVRRFYRLVPASWFWLLACLFMSLAFNAHGTFKAPVDNALDVIAQFFYVSNWRYYFCNNGWGTCGANALYWSLSLEEQFYFLLPVALFFLRGRIAWLCAGLIVVQFPFFRPVFSGLWLTRIDAISWGVLIAIFSQTHVFAKLKPIGLRNSIARGIFACGLLAALAVFAAEQLFPFATGMLAVCSAALVFVAAHNDGLLFRSIRNSRLMMWIGSRSYSIYLSHAIAFFAVMEYCQNRSGLPLGPSDTLRIAAGGLILTVLCAEFSYRVIEKPFRQKGCRIADRMTANYMVAQAAQGVAAPTHVSEAALDVIATQDR